MRPRIQDYAETKQNRVSDDREDVRHRHHHHRHDGVFDNVREGTLILR